MPTVRVTGMTCQGCEDVVETAVNLLDGVEEVDADRYADLVEAKGDVTVEMVAEKVEMAGYRAIGPAEADTASEDDGADDSESADDEQQADPSDAIEPDDIDIESEQEE